MKEKVEANKNFKRKAYRLKIFSLYYCQNFVNLLLTVLSFKTKKKSKPRQLSTCNGILFLWQNCEIFGILSIVKCGNPGAEPITQTVFESIIEPSFV